MKLYIGNPTDRDHEFLYRLVGERPRPTPFRVIIPAHGQVRLMHDLDLHQARAIIEHHEQYGMRPASDKARPNQVIPLVYQEDRPIVREKIDTFYLTNQDTLEAQGEETRRTTAIAVQTTAQAIAAENGTTLKELEIETFEVEKAGATPRLVNTTKVTENEGPTRTLDRAPRAAQAKAAVRKPPANRASAA